MPNQKNRIWKLVGANVFFLGILFLIPIVLGIPSGKIFSSFTNDKYSLYSLLTLIGLILIDILFVIEVFIRKGDKIYGDGLLVASQGELPATQWFSRVSNSTLLFGSICVMSIISTIIFIMFGDLGKITNSTSPLIDLFLILMENVMLATIIAGVIFFTRYIARKYQWKKVSFQATSWFLVITLSGIFGWTMHMYSKSGNQAELIYSLFFWAFIGLVTLFTGSIFAGLGIHLILDFPFFMNLILSDAWVISVFIIMAVASGYFAFRVKSTNIAYTEKDIVTQNFVPDKIPNQNGYKEPMA